MAFSLDATGNLDARPLADAECVLVADDIVALRLQLLAPGETQEGASIRVQVTMSRDQVTWLVERLREALSSNVSKPTIN